MLARWDPAAALLAVAVNAFTAADTRILFTAPACSAPRAEVAYGKVATSARAGVIWALPYLTLASVRVNRRLCQPKGRSCPNVRHPSGILSSLPPSVRHA